MSGNSIGKKFIVTTFGESHGLAVGCIVDGMPPGFELNEHDIQLELNKRRPGKNPYVTPRKELDKIKILSGVFNGITTGTSIGLVIDNNDQRSMDYNNLEYIFRPGHADYTYYHKYGIRDYRGGGRSSARETCMRVAAGAIAKKYLNNNFNIFIRGYLSKIKNINCIFDNWKNLKNNNFYCANSYQIKDIKNILKYIQTRGDSVGAKITIFVENVPKGLGEPVFDKLDANLAHALMSINAVKAVEIGYGFLSISQLGSEFHDLIDRTKFQTNRTGGILGGISNGESIIINIYIKPTPTIKKIKAFNYSLNKETFLKIKGRHDPCVGIRAVPIAEAMTAIIIMDHILRYRSIK